MYVNRLIKDLCRRMKVGAILVMIFLIGLAVMAVVPFLVQLLWGWIVPDLFPGAVAEGLVTRSISWFTAFKLTILLLLFGILAS